jgi:hypothetical protein
LYFQLPVRANGSVKPARHPGGIWPGEPAGNFPAGFGWKLFLTGFAARVLSSKGVFPMIYFLKFIVNIFN